MKTKTFISSLIYRARIQLGITQKEMAKKLGVSRSALSRYENGNRLPPIGIINHVKLLLGAELRKPLVQILDQNQKTKSHWQSRAPPS